jgi:hypothetical protein
MLLRALLVACLCQGLMALPFHSWWNYPAKHEYVYSENPNITEVLSQVNMDTPIVAFHTQFEEEHFVPRTEEVNTYIAINSQSKYHRSFNMHCCVINTNIECSNYDKRDTITHKPPGTTTHYDDLLLLTWLCTDTVTSIRVNTSVVY